MADDRPMAEQLQAPTGGFESAIVFTTINAQNFETKSLTFNLVSKIEFFESYNDQDSLNSTAGGNFLYKSPTEGLQIIENKAKVRCSRNAVMRVSTNALPSSSTSSSSNFEFPTNVWLLTQDHWALLNPIPKLLDLTKDTMGPRFEAYTKANDVTLNNLQKNLNDFKKEQQDFQNEQRNFQNMMLNMFQKQMGNNNASSSGTLPSNTITNPRCEARAITTRSGLSYTPVPPIPPPLFDENESLTEKETEVTKDKVLPSTKDIQPPVIQKSHDPVKPVSSPNSPEPSSAQEEFFLPKSPPIKPNKPTKTLPYPSRVEYEKKGENDKVQIQKFWEMFKKIHVNITLADALILMPKYQKMLKSLLSNKEKLNEMANTPVSENCSAIILKKLPEKLEDPGQFLIPCTFSELKCKALADLGASINLMPFSVYTKLGLPALQSTRMTLELANCSLCVPKGIARDVLVPVGRLTFPADFVVVDFECNYRVPLIFGRPFLRTARVLIDVHGEELVIRDGMERIVFKPDGSQDKESIHMMDIYDDRFKDVCEPESNDSSSPTSTIVEEFDSLVGEIIKQKEEVKEISDPVARRRACFSKLENFRIIHQGRVIHSPKIASVGAISHIFPNNNLEDSFKMGDEDLNFIPNKELDKEDLIPIPRESKIGKECDFPPSFTPFEGSEMLLEEEIDEFLKHDESLNMDLNDEFNDEEGDIIYLEKLLENENFFEMNDKKVESLERKTKEDFETKDEPKSKKDLQVVHPDIEILNHFETTSYVGSDYVFYEDFNLVDMIFPMNIQGKIFNPGITFHANSFEKDAFKDKSSKELAPSKSLLTLDVFDPLYPPLIDFHVNKALFGFTFSLLKIFSKKFFKPGNKNATVYLSSLVWGRFSPLGISSSLLRPTMIT
ncbi:reverse transcriptase domain-containing protein [Tanacetum coccineum]